MSRALAQVYDVTRDHAALLDIVAGARGDIGAAFARFRAAYHDRREFHSCFLLGNSIASDVPDALSALGFKPA